MGDKWLKSLSNSPVDGEQKAVLGDVYSSSHFCDEYHMVTSCGLVSQQSTFALISISSGHAGSFSANRFSDPKFNGGKFKLYDKNWQKHKWIKHKLDLTSKPPLFQQENGILNIGDIFYWDGAYYQISRVTMNEAIIHRLPGCSYSGANYGGQRLTDREPLNFFTRSPEEVFRDVSKHAKIKFCIDQWEWGNQLINSKLCCCDISILLAKGCQCGGS